MPEESVVQTRPQLPPEILSEILRLFCQTNSAPRGDGNTTFNRDRIRVTHICRQWREIALSCPDIWTTIRLDRCPEGDPTSWYGWQLERAKNYPLTIQAFMGWTPGRRATDWLVSLLPRVATLEVHGQNVMSFLNSLAGSNAPALTSILIGASGRIPPRLFAGGTPRLQLIRLEECHEIPVDSPIFLSQSLTHLELINIDRPPPWFWLHGLLQRVSNSLKTLVFDHALPSSLSMDMEDSLPILEFSRLQRLSVHDTFDLLSSFLDSIRIPASTRVDLWMSRIEDEASYEAIYATLSSARSTPFSPTRLLMTQGCSPSYWIKIPTDLRIEGWEDHTLVKTDCIPDQPPSISLSYPPSYKLHFVQCHRLEPSFPVYSKNQFPIPGLSSVHLKSLFIRPSQLWYGTPEPTPTHPTFWDEIAGLPELSTIMVDQPCIEQFIQCLKEDSLAIEAQTDGVYSATQRRFPALKTIFFEGCNAKNITNRGSQGRFTKSTFETLEENIRLRAGIGNGLVSIKFLWWAAYVDEGLEERLSSFIDSVQQYGLSASRDRSSLRVFYGQI